MSLFKNLKNLMSTHDETTNINTNSNNAQNITFSDTTSNNEVNLNTLINSANPSKNGLYPHEILMLYYSQFYKSKEDNFPRFWFYQYGVREPQELLSSLVNKEFLTYTPVEFTLNKLKIPELKELLIKNNLDITGKKGNLIARLLESVPENDLKTQLSFSYYALTPKGTIELKDNTYVVYAHSKKYCPVDIWQANKLIHENPNCKFSDLLWAKLNMIGAEQLANADYGLFYGTCINKAEMLIDENKPKTALTHLMAACYVHLSGLQNDFKIKYLKDYSKFYFPYEKSHLKLPLGLVEKIQNIMKSTQLTNDELIRYFHSTVNIYEEQLPFHLFSNDECLRIILHFITGTPSENEIKQIFVVAENRLKENY